MIKTKAFRKFIGLRKHMKPTPSKMIFKKLFFFSCFFSQLSPSSINLSTAHFTWEKNKTPIFTGILPHITISTMLEAIMKYQDGMADEALGNIVSELRKRGKFGGFSEEMMQFFLEIMWNKVEYALKASQRLAVKLEGCSDSKGMKMVLNGRTFKYHFWGGKFHMIPQSYKFSHSLCLNHFLQFWFIGNQRYQVSPFIYINWDDEVYHLVREMKLLVSILTDFTLN